MIRLLDWIPPGVSFFAIYIRTSRRYYLPKKASLQNRSLEIFQICFIHGDDLIGFYLRRLRNRHLFLQTSLHRRDMSLWCLTYGLVEDGWSHTGAFSNGRWSPLGDFSV